MALPDVGPVMRLTDERYNASAGTIAGRSGSHPISDCPGFDEEVLQSMDQLLGRWVRSPSKFVGWDTYMEFFGLSGDKAFQETEEPQEHVILEFSKEKMRILHRLCWRDGLDCEYTVPLDGSVQPIPPAMVARASSSWKVNDLMSWVHSWDGGDGNPLHIGLRTEQKLCIGGVNYTLRYWRTLISAREMRINVEVTYAETGAYAVHTQRFFHKLEVSHVYAVACLNSQLSLADALRAASTWTHDGRGVRLVILPHSYNMPAGWEDSEPDAQWEAAEPFPTAGRSAGSFVTALRVAACECALWVCCGLVLRSPSPEHKRLIRGVALIGADGWLHGVHADAAPADSRFMAGSGDWPATQRPRPLGVYDTALGRVAMSPDAPDPERIAELAKLGAELIVSPPPKGSPSSRAVVRLGKPSDAPSSPNSWRYEVCGPDALPAAPPADASWKPTIVAGGADGVLSAHSASVPCN